MLPINQLLEQGRYRIINPLGQNGFGVGYEAYDKTLEKNVLLKEISDNLSKVTTPAQMETRKQVFAGRVKILTEFQHESLLQIHNYFSDIDRHYLVAEYLDGNSLHEQVVLQKGPASVEDLTTWGDQLLDAINYLHNFSPPIFHGDINPDNVKLTSDGRVKLLTFSIVQSLKPEENADTANQAAASTDLHFLPLERIFGGLDAASQKVITNSYDEKSEQILKQPIDARSDIFALGATLYYLATARSPIDALERSIDILEGKPDPLPAPNQINRNVPREVSDVIMRALEIKRENRFSSTTIMRQVLRTAFVRAKDRAAEEARKQAETARELFLAEQNMLQTEEAFAGQDILEISVEAPPAKPFFQGLSEGFPAETRSPENKRPMTADKTAPVELGGLFSEPESGGKSFRMMAIVGSIFVVLGGAAAGVWLLNGSNAVESNPTMSTTANTAKPAPTTEAAPQSGYVKTAETGVETEPSAFQSPEATETTENASTAKTRPAGQPTPAQAKKPTPPKVAENKKKDVTLDDLLKDN